MKSIRVMRFIFTVFGLIALLFTSLPAEAQRRGHSLKHRVARMQENLGLSDEQAADVLAIFEAARADDSGREIEEQEHRRECFADKWASVEAQLMVVLTAEQFEAWDEMREERRARRAARRGGQ